MTIRPARLDDIPGMSAIWTPIVTDTLVTFTNHVKTDAELADMIAEKAVVDQPLLVAELDGRIAGFATYGAFRSGPGYARTVEHTILLADWARGRGIGRALMVEIEDFAAVRGIHSLWAGVSGANPGAVAFHEKVGFRAIARLPEVGFKFDQWLDLILLQKILPDRQG